MSDSTSARLRAGTRVQHEQAESRPFVAALMSGSLSLAAYGTYLAQFALIYRALEHRRPERDAPALLNDPALRRSETIEADLVALGVPPNDPRRAPLPATTSYVTRLREVAAGAWQDYLPHHYTRYLGDLSGGQVMATMLRRHYDATDAQLSFFDFTQIPNRVAYKRRYRQQLDELVLSDAQIEAMVGECQDAFALNAAVFDDLAERMPHASLARG